MILALVLSAHAVEPSPRFEGELPLFQWAQWAGDHVNALVCYEGASTTVGKGWALGANLPDAATAVAATHATAYPVRFELRDRGTRQLIVAAKVKDAAGSWGTYVPLLDTHIDLPVAVRNADDALEEWVDAMYVETGQRILLGQMLNGEATSDAGGTDRVARDLLAEILDDHGPYKVWLLVWYEEEHSWILNIRRLWHLEPHTRTPNIPVQGQPPDAPRTPLPVPTHW